MKRLKYILVILLLGFVGIQFVPTRLNQSATEPTIDFTNINSVPGEVENSIRTSCYDCHSNSTDYPWYSKIQPAAWILEGHIREGKEELNFNEFGSYSTRKQKSKLNSIIHQIEDDEMPLPSYTLLHADARLSEIQKKEIITLMNELLDSLNNYK